MIRSHSRYARHVTLIALGISWSLVGGCRVPGADRRNDPEAFHRLPPGVERATIQPLRDGQGHENALLEVEFERTDRRLTEGVPIFMHDETTVLRDDGKRGDAKRGDGVFSARVEFDFQELAAQAGEVAQKLKAEPRAVFRGREIVGIADAELVRTRQKRFGGLGDAATLLRPGSKLDLLDLVSTVDPSDVDPARSLMITATSVVTDPLRTMDPCTGAGDPNGVWTFKHLVSEMVAGTGVDPADFVEQWLRLWTSGQLVSSGFTAAPRLDILSDVLNPWPRTAAGKLDLNRSPFRLSAIVNRIDLADNLAYGGRSAGEGRFVFGVWNRQAGCIFLPFSVIFEYGVVQRGCHGLRKWAKQWVALSSLPLGSPAYNSALAAITEQFAKAHAAPGKPNGSALNQLRTNENALNLIWELREFRLNATTHLLFEDTTKQTPDETLNGSAAVAKYVNDHEAAIVVDKHQVPDRFPTAADPFMAATSRASPGQFNTHFRAPGITNNNARFHFSLNTCTACHIRETSTNNNPPGNTAFLHVDPRELPAKLSRFLTGSTEDITDSPDPFVVTDPVVGATTHAFNDLDNRRQKLAEFAGKHCFGLIITPPRRLLESLRPIGPDPVLPPIPDPRLLGAMNDPVRMVH